MALKGFIPNIFKVAVCGLSGLLFSRQVQLFRELPQAGSVKDPCQRRERQTERVSISARL